MTQTPVPSRFLLSKKRPGTQPRSQADEGGSSSTHQFRATPRFSSTPRPASTQVPQFATPSTLTLKQRSSRPDSTQQDIIESSQVSPENSPPTPADELDVVLSSDPIEVDASFPSQSPEADGHDRVNGEPSPKRRRISISPEPDSNLRAERASTIPPSDESSDDDDDDAPPKTHKTDLLNDVESEWDSEDDSSGMEQEERDMSNDGQDEPRPGARPKFHQAPRFKASEQLEARQQTSLPEVFSPQRRGVKYVAGGLAAELRDWLVEVKGSDDGGQGFANPVSLTAYGVRRMPGLSLVSTADPGGEPGVRVILAGDGKITGLGKPEVAVSGSVITISPPAWDVDLGPATGKWAIACDWTVREDAPKA